MPNPRTDPPPIWASIVRGSATGGTQLTSTPEPTYRRYRAGLLRKLPHATEVVSAGIILGSPPRDVLRGASRRSGWDWISFCCCCSGIQALFFSVRIVSGAMRSGVLRPRSSGSLTPGGWVGRRRLAPTRNLGESVINKRIDADRKLGLKGPVGGAGTHWPDRGELSRGSTAALRRGP
jgi:hypothetical protein